jgi:NADPH-dependent curcumin reductase CurA
MYLLLKLINHVKRRRSRRSGGKQSQLDFKTGDVVIGNLPWQKICQRKEIKKKRLSQPGTCKLLPGHFGHDCATAYFGLMDICET